MEDIQKAVWNIDAAEDYAIFEAKIKFVNCMLEWNLEGAYWAVRTLRMELDAKLQRGDKKYDELIKKLKGDNKKESKKETEKEIVDQLLVELETKRTEYNEATIPSEELRGKFYLMLEAFYMHLCYLMKKHGIYFREGEDSRLAVLRR